MRSHLGALRSINVKKVTTFLAASLFEQFSLVTHLRIDIERLAALNFSFLAGFDVSHFSRRFAGFTTRKEKSRAAGRSISILRLVTKEKLLKKRTGEKSCDFFCEKVPGLD